MGDGGLASDDEDKGIGQLSAKELRLRINMSIILLDRPPLLYVGKASKQGRDKFTHNYSKE